MYLYISQFCFPDKEREADFLMAIKRNCYNTFYPFQVLAGDCPLVLNFEPVTILYGGNGSGKSTAINVIAEKIGLPRDTPFNRSCFFDDYTVLCDMEQEREIPEQSRIITSDDVFDFMLDVRTLNDGIDRKREELFEEYLDVKYSSFQMRSFDDYEQLKKVNSARSRTQSKFVRQNLMGNVRGQSNGESAFRMFTDKIKEDGLYLLDEPENSLSPAKQLELLRFLEDPVRFFGCQFIIATHSPFLLSIRDAKIYDLDEAPVRTKKWTELENVQAYYRFFRQHAEEFPEK